MKMTMVLLVATVALLVSADAAAFNKTLVHNKILSITELFKEHKEYVPDVGQLAVECGSEFFCKVTDILDNNKSTWPKKEELVKNLKTFHKQENVTCTAILKNVQPNGVQIEMKALIEYLKQCMQAKNFRPKKSDSSQTPPVPQGSTWKKE